eukprot:1976509-Prymnesium_polylepis.1
MSGVLCSRAPRISCGSRSQRSRHVVYSFTVEHSASRSSPPSRSYKRWSQEAWSQPNVRVASRSVVESPRHQQSCATRGAGAGAGAGAGDRVAVAGRAAG